MGTRTSGAERADRHGQHWQAAPVIVATRLRRGAAASAHGAVRMVRDGIVTARRAGVTGPVLVRADSAYYNHAFATAVTRAGAWFSIGARQDPAVRRAIASIDDPAWVRIEYSGVGLRRCRRPCAPAACPRAVPAHPAGRLGFVRSRGRGCRARAAPAGARPGAAGLVRTRACHPAQAGSGHSANCRSTRPRPSTTANRRRPGTPTTCGGRKCSGGSACPGCRSASRRRGTIHVLRAGPAGRGTLGSTRRGPRHPLLPLPSAGRQPSG